LRGMRNTRSGKQARKRARRSRAEWTVEVGRWRRSGQSAADYAKAHDLDKGTLGWWGTRLRADANAAAAPRPVREPAFLAVRVSDAQAHETPARPVDTELEVVLANGRRVRIAGDFDAERVGRLLAVAEGVARC
jgi:transposase